MRDRSIARAFDCVNYAECLDRAAKENRRDVECEGCDRYASSDPLVAESKGAERIEHSAKSIYIVILINFSELIGLNQ